MDSLLYESGLMSIEDENTFPQFSTHMSSALLRSESVLSWISLDESSFDDTKSNGEEVCEDFPNRKTFFSKYYENSTTPILKEGSSMESPAVESKSICLGMDYRPSPWDVISGKGDSSFDHVGNRRLRILVACHLPLYMKATNKSERSNILIRLVDIIKESGGTFVRYDRSNRAWYDIGGANAIRRVFHVINYRVHRSADIASVENKDSEELISTAQNDLLWSSINSKSDCLRPQITSPKKRKR